MSVFIVCDGRVPPGRIFGVYDSEKKAEDAIKENDPNDRYSCYIEECDLNEWFQYGVDI